MAIEVMCDIEQVANVSETEGKVAEIIDVELNTSVDQDTNTSQRIDVELGLTQWSLVSDAIYIKDISGNEPQWFIDMVNNAYDDTWIIDGFDEVQTHLSALDDGYTNLVSITDTQATHIEALKVSTDNSTAAISHLESVKITDTQAKAISQETIGVWMNDGESAAWFNQHVQTVATNTSVNTEAIVDLQVMLGDVTAGVTEMSEALVDRYKNSEWVGPGDPDGSGEPEWIYNARAKHSLNVNANGSIAGFVASAQNSDVDGAISQFKIFADVFEVSDRENNGHVAFRIVSDGQGDAKIMFDGDVYFGEIPGDGGSLIDYQLSDISNDLIVDPTEKNALEKTYSDVSEEWDYINSLLNNRYSDLAESPEGAAARQLYNEAYSNMVTLMGQLGIPKLPTAQHFPTTILDRNEFNNVFIDYYNTSTTMKSMLEDKVKQVADDAYNYVAEIVRDNLIDVSEKELITAMLDNIGIEESQYYSKVPGPHDAVAYPDFNGCSPSTYFEFDKYEKDFLHYDQYLMYHGSIYGTFDEGTGVGDCFLTDCATPPDCTVDPNLRYVATADGFDIEMRKYDLADLTQDRVLTDAEKNAILIASDKYVQARSLLNSTILGTTINTKYLRIADTSEDIAYTLIVNDTIQTKTIGEYTAFDNTGEAPVIDPLTASNFLDFPTGMIQMNRDPITDINTFRIDSEASGTFSGLCLDANDSNIRGLLVEGQKGAFAEIYTGTIASYTQCSSGCAKRVKNKTFKSNKDRWNIMMGDITERYTAPLRFYAPENPLDTDEVNDHRIKSFEDSNFMCMATGGYVDRESEDVYFKAGVVVEYRIDDGTWYEMANQVQSGQTGQNTIMFAPICNSHVDFRLRCNFESMFVRHVSVEATLNVILSNI